MGGFIFNRQSHKVFGLRISAIVEIFVFLFIVLVLDFLFGEGTRFVDYSLHPFWIIILLVTVQYGTAEGVFAAIVCTIVLYSYNIPPQLADESFFEYQLRLGKLPALWFIAAFVLGELRTRIEWENERLRNDYLHAKSEVEKITSEYEVVKEINQNLEVQLTSQEETVAASFRVFKALAALEPAQIIFGLNSIIDIALHPKKYSVFAKGPNGLEAVTSEGWEGKDQYTRRFIPSAPLYQTIVNDKKMISIVNKNEQKILQNEGVLASPLVDPESGEVFGMIKVENIDFNCLNLSRLETFNVVCDLIGRAYANAKKHKMSKQLSIYAAFEPLYSFPLYKILRQYLREVAQIFHFSLLELQVNVQGKQMEEMQIRNVLKLLPHQVMSFEGNKKYKEFFFLVPFKEHHEKENLKNQLEEILKKESGLNSHEILLHEEIFSQAGQG